MSEHQRMEVMCHVRNCQFNEKQYCVAPKLEVNAMHGDNATSSKEALCTTFMPQ